MKSQTLFDSGRWGKGAVDKRSPGWEVYIPERPGAKYDDDPAESEAKWQKHVVTLLWVALLFLIVLGCALVFAEGHGLLESLPGHGTPLPPPWPDGS